MTNEDNEELDILETIEEIGPEAFDEVKKGLFDSWARKLIRGKKSGRRRIIAEKGKIAGRDVINIGHEKPGGVKKDGSRIDTTETSFFIFPDKLKKNKNKKNT